MAALFDIFSKGGGKEEEKIEVIVDNREKNSLVAAYLIKQGFAVKFEQLPVADYIVQDVAIERKTVSDFKSSIINKRIIDQLLAMKQYEQHLLILEGICDEDVYSGGIHENAFRGFLLSVALEYNVPVIFTQSSEDTAKYISVLARRKPKGERALRASRILLTAEEQAQFILEGFPHVGPRKAQMLLEKFGSLQNVFEAKEEELEEVLGKRSKEFIDLLYYRGKFSEEKS